MQVAEQIIRYKVAMEAMLKGVPVIRRIIYLHHGLSRTSSLVLSTHRRAFQTQSTTGLSAINSKKTCFSTAVVKSNSALTNFRGVLQVCLFHTDVFQRDSMKPPQSSSLPPKLSQLPVLKSPLRLIDRDGTNLGVLSLEEARQVAMDKGMHIQVVRSSTSQSPEMVCKLATKQDFIDSNKKQREIAKKVRHATKVKEITLKSNIDESDLLRKISKMQEFLESDCRVKVFIRGRRSSTKQIKPLADLIIEKLQSSGRLDGKLSISEESARFYIVPAKH